MTKLIVESEFEYWKRN